MIPFVLMLNLVKNEHLVVIQVDDNASIISIYN